MLCVPQSFWQELMAAAAVLVPILVMVFHTP